MKKSYIITSLIAFTSIAQAQEATAEKPAETPTPETSQPNGDKLRKISEKFSNLPEDKREQYMKSRNEASQLFQNKRIFETLEIVRQLETIFKEDPQLLNLKGACYVELRNFDAARQVFKEALDIAGPSSSVLFNLAEIEFVTDNWQKSIDQFNEVRKLTNKNKTQLLHLIDFKILLCHIKRSEDKSIDLAERQKHKKLVSDYADKVDRFTDSPYYYYANAARYYYLGDKQKADTFLASGRRVFSSSPQLTASWEDTLVEFGYIKSNLSEIEQEKNTPLEP